MRAATAMEQRGVSPDQVASYQVGYAPAGWTALIDHLRTRGYTDPELLEGGVAMTTSRGSVVDRFRDRIMFPVHDPAGQVIAFIGRALEPGGDTPKYLNSPETTLYRKSEVLYGLGAEPTRHALTAAQHHGRAALHNALDEAVPLADMVVDKHVDQWTSQLRWVEGRLGAARAAAPVIARLPAEHMPRQINRLVERLDLHPETISTAVANAIARGAGAPGQLESQDGPDRGRSVSVSSTPSQLARAGYPVLLPDAAGVAMGGDHGHPSTLVRHSKQLPVSGECVGLL